MSPSLSHDYRPAGGSQSCLECQSLELQRSEWIQRYMDLRSRRKLSLLAGKLPVGELSEALASAEAELRKLSRRLEEHSSLHPAAELAAVNTPS